MKNTNSNIIFHIDVNSAFLSWSAIKLLKEGSPLDIRTVPSIVGGDRQTRHGIVVAKSIPAKKYGIHTADTVASALKRCPELILVPPDHAYYRKMSAALMDFLRNICPVLEQVSVDECYMDFKPIRARFASPEDAAAYIKDGIREALGFTVNIGISDRKVLAKTASDFEKPDKIHTLYSYEIAEKFWVMPIEKLYMCGKSTAEAFRRHGIKTIGDLAAIDRAYAEEIFDKHRLMLWRFANGIDDSRVNPEKEQAKGVGNSVTLPHNLTARGEARPILKKLSKSVSERLKKKNLTAGTVCVSIKYDDFSSSSRQTQLTASTSEEADIYNEACRLFDELWDGSPVRLLGVRTTKVSDETAPRQLTLFDYGKEVTKEIQNEKVEKMMDDVRRKFGDGAVRKGI